MIEELPAFRMWKPRMVKPPTVGEFQYRELSPKEGRYRYRFLYLAPVAYVVKVPAGFWEWSDKTAEFRDRSGRCWMKMRSHPKGIEVEVQPDYAWNGNSPKRWIWPFGWVGTPDPESTHAASGLHDPLCQFAGCEHMPFSRKDADTCFYDVLNLSKFCAKGTWHGAVRFGAVAQPNQNPDAYSVLV